MVELLVVIAIIGILAATILVQLGSVRTKARDAKRVGDLNQIQVAIEAYNADSDTGYPPSTDAATSAAWSVGLIAKLIPKYIAALPVDPKTNTAPYTYNYGADAGGTRYQLSAELETAGNRALSSDVDFTAAELAAVPAITGGRPGGPAATIEICTTADNDCIFDLGQK